MSSCATEILRTSGEQLLKTEAAIQKSASEFTGGDGVGWTELQSGGKLAGNKLQWREGGISFYWVAKRQRTSDRSWYWTKRKSSWKAHLTLRRAWFSYQARNLQIGESNNWSFTVFFGYWSVKNTIDRILDRSTWMRLEDNKQLMCSDLFYFELLITGFSRFSQGHEIF